MNKCHNHNDVITLHDCGLPFLNTTCHTSTAEIQYYIQYVHTYVCAHTGAPLAEGCAQPPPTGLYLPSDATGDVAVSEEVRSQAPEDSHVYHSSANYHKGISEENCQDDHLDERALVSEEDPGTKPEQLEYCIDSKEEQEHHLKTGMNLQQ